MHRLGHTPARCAFLGIAEQSLSAMQTCSVNSGPLITSSLLQAAGNPGHTPACEYGCTHLDSSPLAPPLPSWDIHLLPITPSSDYLVTLAAFLACTVWWDWV